MENIDNHIQKRNVRDTDLRITLREEALLQYLPQSLLTFGCTMPLSFNNKKMHKNGSFGVIMIIPYTY